MSQKTQFSCEYEIKIYKWQLIGKSRHLFAFIHHHQQQQHFLTSSPRNFQTIFPNFHQTPSVCMCQGKGSIYEYIRSLDWSKPDPDDVDLDKQHDRMVVGVCVITDQEQLACFLARTGKGRRRKRVGFFMTDRSPCLGQSQLVVALRCRRTTHGPMISRSCMHVFVLASGWNTITIGFVS